MRLLERVFDGERVEVETLQDGKRVFVGLGGEVNPQQSALVAQRMLKFSGGEVDACRFVVGEIYGSYHRKWAPKRQKFIFYGFLFNNFNFEIKIIEFFLTKFKI